MKTIKVLLIALVAMLSGNAICVACGGCCGHNKAETEVVQAEEVEAKEASQAPAAEEITVVQNDDDLSAEALAEADEDDDEEDFDAEAFAKFAQRLRDDGDIDTTVRVVDDKDEV